MLIKVLFPHVWERSQRYHLMHRKPQRPSRRGLELAGSSCCLSLSCWSLALGGDFLKGPQENPERLILTNVKLLSNCLGAWHVDFACLGENFTPNHAARLYVILFWGQIPL